MGHTPIRIPDCIASTTVDFAIGRVTEAAGVQFVAAAKAGETVLVIVLGPGPDLFGLEDRSTATRTSVALMHIAPDGGGVGWTHGAGAVVEVLAEAALAEDLPLQKRIRLAKIKCYFIVSRICLALRNRKRT